MQTIGKHLSAILETVSIYRLFNCWATLIKINGQVLRILQCPLSPNSIEGEADGRVRLAIESVHVCCIRF